MSKPIIAIKLEPKNYAGFVNLGNRVFASMTGNLDFPTPAPALSVLQTNITSVVNAIAAWGQKGNRGSHDDLANLRQQSIALAQTLKSLSQYVQNTAQTASGSDYPAMTAMITGSGFQLASPRSPQGILQAVQNFHLFISRRFNPNQAKLKWKMPLNVTSKTNVKSYAVYRGTTPVFSAAVQIAAPTKTTYVDTNTTAAPVTWYYWVVAVNTAGDGAISEVVSVSLFNI
jgi:hypothetical protein